VLPVELHDEADEEQTDAALYLDAERAGYGDLFLDELTTLFDEIATYPLIGARVGRRARKLPMNRFRYSIIYQPTHDRIFVVAIAHHSRRPGYWRPRLR
jgi:toxin ParE1/3/4